MASKILMPKLSDTMVEGVILKWLKHEGEKVKQGETLVEIESDKADMELEAYDSGVLRKILVPDGGKAGIGAPIGIIAKADEDITALLGESPIPPQKPPVKETAKGEPQRTSPLPPSQPEKPAEPHNGRLKASPLAKRIAMENKLELRSISGSGPQGRIIKRDIEPIIGKNRLTAAAAAIIPGKHRDVELSLIRKTIAKRMQESKQTVPHFYVTLEIDMEPATAFREQLNTATDSEGQFYRHPGESSCQHVDATPQCQRHVQRRHDASIWRSTYRRGCGTGRWISNTRTEKLRTKNHSAD